MIDGGKFFSELLKTKNTEAEREAKIGLENWGRSGKKRGC